jgi:hypothetical protein
MIPIEKLQAIKTIITHENCADGVVSAMFLHDVIPEAEIRFVQYGTEERLTLEATPGMLFCDFTPHPDHVQKFVEAGSIVLDHHKGAQGDVAAFGENGVFGDEVGQPGVCGAVLAYREVWLPMSHDLPESSRMIGEEIALLTGVRDTWLNKHPLWEAACIAATALRPSTSVFPAESWLTLKHPFSLENQKWWAGRFEVGEWLNRKKNQSVEKALKGAHHFTSSRGTRVVLFSGITLSSDAAESVGATADLVVGFDYVGIEAGAGTLVFSTRSHTDFNCVSFCKFWGGGGHTKAAGFSVKFNIAEGAQDPYSVFAMHLERYEASL